MDRGHIWNRQDTGSWGMELATPGLWAVNDCIRFYSHCIFSRSTVGRFYLLSSIVHGISIKNKKIRRFKVTLFIHLLCSIHSQKFNIIYSKQCTDPPTDKTGIVSVTFILACQKEKENHEHWYFMTTLDQHIVSVCVPKKCQAEVWLQHWILGYSTPSCFRFTQQKVQSSGRKAGTGWLLCSL